MSNNTITIEIELKGVKTRVLGVLRIGEGPKYVLEGWRIS